MNSQPPKSPKNTPIEQLDEETQREIAREGGPGAVTENVGNGFNAENPPGHSDNNADIPAPSTGHKWDEPGESQHKLNPEDQAEPLEHAGATEESQPADDEDQMVKGRPPLKEMAQLGGDEQGDAEDQDEDYQPRDEITSG